MEKCKRYFYDFQEIKPIHQLDGLFRQSYRSIYGLAFCRTNSLVTPVYRKALICRKRFEMPNGLAHWHLPTYIILRNMFVPLICINLMEKHLFHRFFFIFFIDVSTESTYLSSEIVNCFRCIWAERSICYRLHH